MKLFGTAGIRKKYPDELSPLTSYRIGLAVASLGLSSTAYVVYDTRTTNHLFTYSFSSGLMAGGVDVYVVGLAPTPVAGYAARKYKAIGVSVTASHNPPEYNGFKLYDPEGYEFTRDLEVAVEERVVKLPEATSWDSVGKLYLRSDVVDSYVKDIIEYLEKPKPSWSPYIVVDLANGAAYDVTPKVMRALGAVPLTINANPDGFFPVRPPEPRKDSLEKYLDLYRAVNPVAIFAHDGDADRLAVLDPVDGFIRQDRIIAFYAYLLLREGARGRVVVSVDTGNVVDDIVERFGGATVERYVLGKTHERIKELGLESIVLAAEPWKLIDPRWGPWVDGVWQVAILTREIVARGKRIAKILEEAGIPDYPWDRRSYLIEPLSIRDRVYASIVEELKGVLGEPVEVLDIDGYRYEYKDRSWVLVRKSGTEPKIRIYAEALREERLRDMVDKLESVLYEKVKLLGGRVVERTIG